MVFQVSVSCDSKGSIVNLLIMKAHLSVVLMVFQVSISCGSKGSFVNLVSNISSTFNLMLVKLIFLYIFLKYSRAGEQDMQQFKCLCSSFFLQMYE